MSGSTSSTRKFSPRGKAIADIVTSVFFFIFMLHACCGPAGRFALTQSATGEVSFTEWGVQYWPVKLTMPIGAALMAAARVSKLIKDIVILSRRGRA